MCELSLGSSDKKDPLCVACTLGNIVNKQNNNFLQQVYATLCLHVSRCNNGLLQQTFVIKSMILACKQFLIHFFFFLRFRGSHVCYCQDYYICCHLGAAQQDKNITLTYRQVKIEVKANIKCLIRCKNSISAL